MTIAGAVALAGSAFAAPRIAQPEPGSRPDWTAVRTKSEAALKQGLIDPASAQFTWTSGFAWGEIKPALKPRIWAWVGCVAVNAKNRFGGYVGAESRYVAYTPAGDLFVGRSDWAVSQCSSEGKVPVQPELVAEPVAPESSVAAQLAQLAGLLDRGLITRAEFDNQKAAILSRTSAKSEK